MRIHEVLHGVVGVVVGLWVGEGDGGAAAYANAQRQQQRGMAYVNNLNSLSQNDSRGFSSGGINPWA